MNSDNSEASPEGERTAGETLTTRTKAIFATGDHTVNLALSALALVFLFFLTEVAGMRPALAGLVIWTARAVDAVTDPLMGRISDRTSWKRGRRRPYFLIGALPFGLFFSMLWLTPFTGQAQMFSYYVCAYIGLSLSMTVLSVPYMALIPEMARGYDERTSLNAFRGAAAVLGTAFAAGMERFAAALGGGVDGFRIAGLTLAVWLVLPWLAVYRVSFERPQRAEPGSRHTTGALEAFRMIARHANYRRLCALYISARIAVDLAGLGLIYFFTYWLGRREDFSLMLLSMLGVVILSLPFWLKAARTRDKHRIFTWGAIWWTAWLVALAFVTPDWPRWMIFVFAGLSGVGYAVADLMPWAMLGEVIDEDELLSGERREGIYNGVFTFLRKLGGATAFLLAGLVLELTGYARNGTQPESALLAIRGLTTLVPAFFLLVAIKVAIRYPLGRARHQQILEALDRPTSNV